MFHNFYCNLAATASDRFTVTMTTISIGQPPIGADYHKDPKQNYVDILKQPQPAYKSIPLKLVVYLHGEPCVIWDEEEVD